MANLRVALRYAKSILDLAIEKGELEKVYSDMLYLQALTKQSKEFLNLLRSPVIKADLKRKTVELITTGKISPLTNVFVDLMINKGREAVLPEIASSFIEQYKEYKGIHTVKLTTATPISDAIKNQIIDRVKTTTNYETIELIEIVDPEIIGGFILQTGDKLVDASIAYDLKTISREFENNDFVYKVR